MTIEPLEWPNPLEDEPGESEGVAKNGFGTGRRELYSCRFSDLPEGGRCQSCGVPASNLRVHIAPELFCHCEIAAFIAREVRCRCNRCEEGE